MVFQRKLFFFSANWTARSVFSIIDQIFISLRNSLILRSTTFPKKHSKILTQFATFFTFYNRWYHSINRIEIVIKIKPEKALKLNFLDTFFAKLILCRFKEFRGLQDELKII